MKNHKNVDEARRHAIRHAINALERPEEQAFRVHCRLYNVLRAFHPLSVDNEAIVVAAAILAGARELEAMLDAMPTAGRGAKP